MMPALILLPLAAAALAFAVRSNSLRPWLLPVTSLAHLALVVAALGDPPAPQFNNWLAFDPLSRLVLTLISVLFFLCSVYAPAYLRLRAERPNRTFCACLLVALSMMTLVALSHHLGLMWVGVEATTLFCGPLLYFNHNPRSLEATWKYLLIGSVGIALALLGSFFLAYSAVFAGLKSTLLFDDLVREAPSLSEPWLHTAFVLLFVGYGTKMGLAPMHTWKPGAYAEAPGMVGALLAGGVTSCSFLAILRLFQICQAAGQAEFARRILIVFGLLSMIVAAVFLVRQKDFKRMLAYSSVEHMGILVLGVGIGGLALFGALLHLVNNALAKGVLFLSAGNIHRAYGSKQVEDVQGVLRRLPISGWLFLGGFLAITGAPPGGPFVSEFAIASGAFQSRQFLAGGLYLLMLAVIFVGMGATVLRIVQGPAPETSATDPTFHDSARTSLPILAFMALVLMMGTWIPQPVNKLLSEAVAFVEDSTNSVTRVASRAYQQTEDLRRSATEDRPALPRQRQ